MKFIDLFGGIGGFRYGIERVTQNKKDLQRRTRSTSHLQPGRDSTDCEGDAWKGNSDNGTECVFYCDNDKYAVQTYNKNFGENWKPTDIRTIDADKLPDFDMLCGGFPCQAFSIAGKRRGFEDTRGTLFFEVARIIKAKRPKIVWLENVKGLLNHEKGKTFRVIIQTLDELGYDTQWMVLNSKFFGVPQNRERVFIIGSLRGTSRPEILPFRENAREVPELPKRETKIILDAGMVRRGEWGDGIHEKTTGTLNSSSGRDFIVKKIINNKGKNTERADGNTFTLTGSGRNCGSNQGVYKMHRADQIRKHKESPTLTSNMGTGGNNVPMVSNSNPTEIKKNDLVMTQVHNMQPRSPNRPSLKYSSGGSGHLQRDDISYCLDGGNTNALEFNDRSLRRLTPVECERLQGFPDNWTKFGKNDKGEIVNTSDTQRYKQLGNAVTVNVIEAIARKLFANEK